MKYILNSKQVIDNCIKAIQDIDLSITPFMCVEILPFRKMRTSKQNALMWSGMIGDFSKQGIINGMQFSTDAWHKLLKEEFLPEHPIPGKTKKNYMKWVILPNGEKRLNASTKDLTTAGFADYLDECYAYGAREIEIRFSASPNQRN